MHRLRSRPATHRVPPGPALALALLLAACAATPATDAPPAPAPAAERPSTAPSAADRIVAVAREDNRVQEHLRALCDFGPRLTGSSGLQRSAEWARAQFGSWGLDAELEVWGEVPVGFERGPWSGGMVAPEALAYDFTTMAWTPGTDGPWRGGALAYPETDEELAALEPRMAGAWLVRPSTERAVDRDRDEAAEWRREVQAAMQAAGALGEVRSAGSNLGAHGREPPRGVGRPAVPGQHRAAQGPVRRPGPARRVRRRRRARVRRRQPLRRGPRGAGQRGRRPGRRRAPGRVRHRVRSPRRLGRRRGRGGQRHRRGDHHGGRAAAGRRGRAPGADGPLHPVDRGGAGAPRLARLRRGPPRADAEDQRRPEPRRRDELPVRALDHPGDGAAARPGLRAGGRPGPRVPVRAGRARGPLRLRGERPRPVRARGRAGLLLAPVGALGLRPAPPHAVRHVRRGHPRVPGALGPRRRAHGLRHRRAGRAARPPQHGAHRPAAHGRAARRDRRAARLPADQGGRGRPGSRGTRSSPSTARP